MSKEPTFEDAGFEHIYHRGMAEALGVSIDRLNRMGLRELAVLALERGYTITVDMNGVGPGLTLRSVTEEKQATA